MPLLEVRHLEKSYPTSEGRLRVLQDIDLELDAGVSLALTGEWGSGKSTLLHLIASLDADRALRAAGIQTK